MKNYRVRISAIPPPGPRLYEWVDVEAESPESAGREAFYSMYVRGYRSVVVGAAHLLPDPTSESKKEGPLDGRAFDP